MKDYQKTIFGQFKDQDIIRYTFKNDLGYCLSVMTYGATILEYVTPDKQGHFDNIILAFDTFEAYIGNGPRYGASIGPVGGRIAEAKFELNQQTYPLLANNGPNNLHSDPAGFDATVFQVDEVSNEGITFYTERPDGTGGFPGNLHVWIRFELTEVGELKISYRLKTDKDTLVNPTNHSYFNLSGDFLRSIDHEIFQLDTDGFYPVTETSIPKGKLDSQATFLQSIQVGVALEKIFADSHDQLAVVGGGLDHPFQLTSPSHQAGSLYDPETGRHLIFKTDRPTVVVYTANFADDRNHVSARTHNGIALETQVLPDAIHSDKKHEVILGAGQEFTSQTVYYAKAMD